MNLTRTVLIVEDNPNLGNTLLEYLQEKDFDAKLAKTFSDGIRLFNQVQPQIVIMDIGLPDGNGLDLAKEMKSQRKNFVLLFLSAQNDPEIRLLGLELGADDYISKPFNLKELTLRLERILSQNHLAQKQNSEIKIGKLIIKFPSYELIDANGVTISLNQKEEAILNYLYQNQGKAVSRDEIIEYAWGDNQFPSNRTVDNYIVKLRKWIETDPTAPIAINSIRGIGYQLLIKEKANE